MSWKRTFVSVFLSGFFCLIVFAAFDGEWPDYSAAEWLVLVGGLAVLALIFIAIEARFAGKETDT